MTSILPLLVTADIEIAHDRDLDAQRDALRITRRQLAGAPATLFVTADAAEAFAPELRALTEDGHEIACHGRDHGPLEDYRHLSMPDALQILSEATDRIARALGVRPRLFRGPGFTTSAATHAALARLDYVADFSVCAHRVDAFASRGFVWEWPRTGPTPYRAAGTDPYSALAAQASHDDAGLWVVPLSGAGAPFISALPYMIGVAASARFASALAAMARHRDAPLVYLFHSYEYAALLPGRDNRPVHQRLYCADPAQRATRNAGLLRKLCDTPQMQPMTGSTFIDILGKGTFQNAA